MFTRLKNFYSNSIYRSRSNRSSSKAVALTFLISLIVSLAIAWKTEQNRLVQERNRISDIAEEYATDIQRSLERTLSITYAVSALVRDYQGIIPNFKTVSQKLLPLYPGASALALLPKNGDLRIVSEPNSKTLIDEEQLKNLYPEETSFSDKTEQLILMLPDTSNFTFSEGIGYLPIFLENRQGNSYFWGFAIITVHFPKLLTDVDLETLNDKNIAYEILQNSYNTQQKQTIASSIIAISNNPVEQIINAGNTTWTIKLTPVAGWKKNHQLWFKLLLASAFSIILALIVKLLLDFKASAFESETIAYFDPLTSLPNRRLLLYRLEKIILQTKRTEKNTAICHLNLDDFKLFNSRLGRKAGDYILVRIAKRLQKFLRAEDVIARIGEDDFVIVLQGLSSIREAELIIERIITAIISPITINSEIVSVSASVGVVTYPRNNDSIDKLLDYANQAMGYAKKNNKGSYNLFHDLKPLRL